jgi:hypothetical protein
MSTYTEQSLSDEEYREVITENGCYRITAPVTLVRRGGGVTHRVIDANGMVHCYPAPETGKSIIRWKPKAGTKPIAF